MLDAGRVVDVRGLERFGHLDAGILDVGHDGRGMCSRA